MTIAVAVKIHDGIVLAADSATTLTLVDGGAQVYDNANKIFHLHRELPIGAMTWGLGNVGAASISTIAKDLRHFLMDGRDGHADWRLDPDDYSIEGVALRFAELVFDELGGKDEVGGEVGALGLLVAGYSSNSKVAEIWTVVGHEPGVIPTPVLQANENEAGWYAYAQGDIVARLLNGFDPRALHVLEQILTPEQFEEFVRWMAEAGIAQPAAIAPMPLADAIALAEFLVQTAIGYARFRLGADTVGGPVEVAAVSRHESFKWVRRKHYYPAELNPKV